MIVKVKDKVKLSVYGLPEQINDTDGYHRNCYNSFTALMAKYRNLSEINFSSAVDLPSTSSSASTSNTEVSVQTTLSDETSENSHTEVNVQDIDTSNTTILPDSLVRCALMNATTTASQVARMISRGVTEMAYLKTGLPEILAQKRCQLLDYYDNDSLFNSTIEYQTQSDTSSNNKTPMQHAGPTLKFLELKRHLANSKRTEAGIKRCRRHLQFASADSQYGSQCQRPDMTCDDYNNAKTLFFSNLRQQTMNRHEIERNTVLQAESALWLELRRCILTASMFSKICKRRPNTDSAPLVKTLLYSYDLGHRLLHHQDKYLISNHRLSRLRVVKYLISNHRLSRLRAIKYLISNHRLSRLRAVKNLISNHRLSRLRVIKYLISNHRPSRLRAIKYLISNHRLSRLRAVKQYFHQRHYVPTQKLPLGKLQIDTPEKEAVRKEYEERQKRLKDKQLEAPFSGRDGRLPEPYRPTARCYGFIRLSSLDEYAVFLCASGDFVWLSYLWDFQVVLEREPYMMSTEEGGIPLFSSTVLITCLQPGMRDAVGAGSFGDHSGQALSNVSPQLPSACRVMELGVSCLNSGEGHLLPCSHRTGILELRAGPNLVSLKRASPNISKISSGKLCSVSVFTTTSCTAAVAVSGATGSDETLQCAISADSNNWIDSIRMFTIKENMARKFHSGGIPIQCSQFTIFVTEKNNKPGSSNASKQKIENKPGPSRASSQKRKQYSTKMNKTEAVTSKVAIFDPGTYTYQAVIMNRSRPLTSLTDEQLWKILQDSDEEENIVEGLEDSECGELSENIETVENIIDFDY
ncbi:hypothetical protein HW555_013919 [Spodoptera exigua]|uniref:Uncharacterized protein n=1 Tax=Spodoptera exigua TaxID=7107 RepID=A0A835G3R0_SPOEX|nr:hypothetical protein HW555_013919 [Spodoptera exigua]